MKKNKKLIILGDSAFAEVAYECFSHDSDYQVVAFSVEQSFLRKSEMFGLPIVPFETIHEYFQPGEVEFYVAVVYTKLNRLRERLYTEAKGKGYAAATYVSSRAFVWPNATVGEHSFIFEDNTIQPFASIGKNVVLWSGNHVGHHTRVEDHCFISSHVVLSGFCTVGTHSFLGVNCSIGNNVSIGKDNWLGPGVTIIRDTEENSLFGGVQSAKAKVSAKRFFRVGDN